MGSGDKDGDAVTAADRRKARLAAELRRNLARRKAQSRQRAETEPSPDGNETDGATGGSE